MSEEFDPRNRELCPNGACIGLIGPDGHCKECGRPGPATVQDPRSRGMRRAEDIVDELEARVIKGDLPEPPSDFDDRRLCPDGACIGVIGPDGRCKECGTPAPVE